MLKNAFGFGGHNISLVLSAPDISAERWAYSSTF